MKKILFSSLGAFVFLLSCQNKPSVENPSPEIPSVTPETKQPAPIVLSVPERSVASAANSFGLKVFSFLSSGERAQDLLFSPLSLSLDLTLCAGGANGETQAQILSSMGLGKEQDAAASYYQTMVAGLVSADPYTQFTSANSVWVHNDFTPAEPFVDYAQSYFDASVQRRDLSVKEGLAEINRWCQEKTGGLLDKMVDDSRNPDQAPVALLLNALYFNGGWTDPFDQVQEAPFHGVAGERSANFLVGKSNYGYLETERAQLVSIPYGCGLFRFVVAVPKEGIALDDMAESLREQDFFGLSTSDPVNVQIPEFELSYSTGDALIPALQSCGITDAFNAKTADFSKLLEGHDPLFISKVLQKSVIRVDEKGTEAAAETGIGMDGDDVGGHEVVERTVVANRPFVFALVESSSRSILFLGKKLL